MSRSPRRIFTSPFVLTLATELAVMPACVVSSTPANQQTAQNPNTRPPQPQTQPTTPTTAVMENPPRPQTEPTPPKVVVMENPPRPQVDPKPPVATTNPPPPQVDPTKPVGPGQVTPKPQGPSPARHWVVARTGSACLATDTDACRAKPAPRSGADKTPPCISPQSKVACPNGLADGGTLNIIKYANQNACTVVIATGACPAGASCNPPPPRAIACP